MRIGFTISPPLPIAAARIGVLWRIAEGGIGVTARTDESGEPLIGLYPIDKHGQPSGYPLEFPRPRLMLDIVVGFSEGKPIIVFIDIEITAQGLDVGVCVPVHMVAHGYFRHLFARWGNKAPHFADYPANSNWPIQNIIYEF